MSEHLYLAFDDWDSGYTIRKVRLSPGSDSGKGEGEGAKQPLPEVFTRIWAPRGLPRYFASAFGTKILVLHAGASDAIGVPIIDVKNQSFCFDLQPNYPACPIYFPIGDDRLFALDISTFDFCYGKPDTTPWVWHNLTYPPFRRHEVLSYTVQPDGCILVSIKNDATAAKATYIFDTEKLWWDLYGHWALPFTGFGHYTPSLDAFVGLSNDPDTLGYLYSCTMASTDTGDTGNILHPSPDCKHSKETVYSKNPAERHLGATLVHMRSDKFCLVECVAIDYTRADQELREPVVAQELREPGVDQELRDPVVDQELKEMGIDVELLRQEIDQELRELGIDEELLQPGTPVSDHFMYRLKTFSVRHDANGDLKLEHCRVCCYSVPDETSIGYILQDPLAFWL